MAVHILSIFQDLVGDQLADHASNFLGESKDNTSTALSSILPSILGGLVAKSNRPDGASSILDFIRNEGLDGSMLDGIGNILAVGQDTNTYLERGSGMLNFIFGSNSDVLGSIIEVVTGQAGVAKNSVSSLLNMAAPLLMSLLGRLTKKDKLDSAGIASLLDDQRGFLQNSMPRAIINKLGLSSLEKSVTGTDSPATELVVETTEISKEKTKEASETTEEVTDQASAPPSPNRIGPWLLLIAIAAGLMYVMRSCGGRDVAENQDDQTEQLAENTDGTTKEVVESTKEMTKSANEEVADAADQTTKAGENNTRQIENDIATIKLRLPGGKEIEAQAGTFIDNLHNYIAGGNGDVNTAFIFDNLNFETGSSSIDSTSLVQIRALADIMNAYPNVTIRIEGHTNHTGDAASNKSISDQRALAVKKQLNDYGVGNERISAIGMGQEKPIISKETEVEKQENRRVEIYITRK